MRRLGQCTGGPFWSRGPEARRAVRSTAAAAVAGVGRAPEPGAESAVRIAPVGAGAVGCS